MKKVAVIGSVASRGAFELQKWFQIEEFQYNYELIQYQSSIISIMDPNKPRSLEYNKEKLSEFAIKTLQNDIHSNIKERLSNLNPDALIVDFMSDVLYGISLINGVYLTKNSRMKHIKETATNTLTLQNDKDEYLTLFHNALTNLLDYCKENLKSTKVIIHTAPFVNSYMSKLGIERNMRRYDTQAKNRLMQDLKEVSNGINRDLYHIDLNEKKYYSIESHPWKLAFNNYERKYYIDFLIALENILNQ